MRDRAQLHGASARRKGISLVEVLVALVLVTVGLLGMAGTSALTLRAARAASHEQRAVRRMTMRLARLEASGCAAAASGAALDASAGISERWTVRPAGGGLAPVDIQIEWQTAADGPRIIAARGAILC